MKEYPATLVELPDASCWVRLGGKMLRIDDLPWLLEQPVTQTVTVGGTAPKVVLDGVKAIADANGLKNGSVTVEVEVSKADLADAERTASRIAKRVDDKLRRVVKKGGKKEPTDAALVARAKKLVEQMGYSIARAAAAVQVPYGTIYGIAKRDGWDLSEKGPAEAPAPKKTQAKPEGRCQSCKRKTKGSPCQHCFERVPELEAS